MEYVWLMVWNILYFSIQLGMSSSQLTSIVQRGRYTTNIVHEVCIFPSTHPRLAGVKKPEAEAMGEAEDKPSSAMGDSSLHEDPSEKTTRNLLNKIQSAQMPCDQKSKDLWHVWNFQISRIQKYHQIDLPHWISKILQVILNCIKLYVLQKDPNQYCWVNFITTSRGDRNSYCRFDG